MIEPSDRPGQASIENSTASSVETDDQRQRSAHHRGEHGRDVQRRPSLLAGPASTRVASPTASTSCSCRHDRRHTPRRSSSPATCSSSRRATPTATRSARTRAATRASCASSTTARSRSPSTTATACSSRSATSAATPHVGMLFIDFEQPNRLRVNGVATVDQRRSAARRVDRARRSSCACGPTQVFPNCARYIHKMQLVERSTFVPQRDTDAPIPDWKRMTWAQEYLPDADPRDGRSARLTHTRGAVTREERALGSPGGGGRSDRPATRANRTGTGRHGPMRQIAKRYPVAPPVSTVAGQILHVLRNMCLRISAPVAKG